MRLILAALLLATAVPTASLAGLDRHGGNPESQQFVSDATPSRHYRHRKHHRGTARAHRGSHSNNATAGINLMSLIKKQADQIEQMKREIEAIRREFRPGSVALEQPHDGVGNVGASALIELPKEAAPESKRDDGPVMPATAIQRGQWNDQRPRHRHAGIDLAGVHGSPIVASYAGRVLPPPGSDRGYGPHVIVIRGNDGIVYRYAHLETASVKVGEYVATGQRIGTMGKLRGPFSMPHLHFEMMRVADYRRRPYGVHSINPNDYLGGSRGTRMVAGAPMTGDAAHRYASRHP